MFTVPATFLLYNLLLLFCPMLSHLSDRTDSRWCRLLAYGLLLFFSVVRFDIGADYLNHSEMFAEKAQLLSYGWGALSVLDLLKPEPLIYLMIFITKDLPMSYVYVFALISVTTIIFLYKAFDYYKAHTIGLFVFVVSYIYFETYDWARQGLAMSIFLYATRFIGERRPMRFFVFMFMSVLCHYSSVILLPFYFLGRYMPQHRLVPVLLAGFLVLMLGAGVAGVFGSMHERITSLIPFYGQLYANTKYTQNGAGTYRTPTYIASMLCFIAVVFMSRPRHAGLAVILTAGAAIYAIAGGNLNFVRMAWPLTAVRLVLIPLAFQTDDVETYNRTFVRYMFLFLLMIFIFEWVYIHSNFRDVVPYETIFSDEFARQIFRIRAY